ISGATIVERKRRNFRASPLESKREGVFLDSPFCTNIQLSYREIVSGILDLSHPMSPEAAQGSYMITAWLQSGEQISHSFDIKEYVLPKFEVKVHLPSIITILDQEAPLKICVILKGSGQVSFTSQIRTVTFKDVSAAYKPGIAFEGKVTTVFNNQLRLQPIPTYLLCMSLFCVSGHFLAVSVNRGELSVSLQRMTDLAPVAQVVVYTVMPSGEGVADSQDFPVQLCFNNKVSLKFSSEQELPGEKTKLSVQAQPGSLCSVRAIDQSVLLLQPDDQTSLLNSLFYHLQEIGIKIVTNSDVKKPYDCLMKRDYSYSSYLCADIVQGRRILEGTGMILPTAAKKTKQTVRKYFPETWIWELVSVGDSGSVNVEKTVPDSITKWAAGAFCTSSAGFGVAPNTALTAFQPFFVSLTLPYSVIRGEVFTLKATVFNYLTKCIMVKVTLADSEQYTFRECDDCQYTVCLCGEESRTFMWIVTPTALGEVSLKVSAEALKTEQLCGNEVAAVPEKGQIDTVVRTLLVEVNGPVEKDVSLLLPEMFVAGSAKASVSVLGDLMGRAMQNLDRLLAMPYGCGEQNMVLFAPNIFILNYLKSTGQLTKEIQDRATRFLESGYQRELTYKHDDGSYSAFGKSDESGNTWLTSFVMKSFGGAKPYIFVDPKHIADARKWLASHQRQDGCINSVGKLFHNGMKGGVSDDVSLTAYITAAMLELDANVTEPVVEKCLGCLKAAVAGQLDNLYTTALLSYTFTLAGDEETRSKLLTYLHQKANTEGGTRHWERAGASAKRLDSLEVEMTSYVLLALLSGPAMPEFSLDYSSAIVRWLAQQQNAYGGFSSTQDTVVALQALAKYGAATYSPEGASTVTVTSLGGQKKEFTVDQDNRLLYQEEKLTEVPGEYKIRAEGRSCVLAQVRRPPCTVCPRGEVWPLQRQTVTRYIPSCSLFSLALCLQLKKDETKSYSVTLEEDIPVRNLKPAVVKVYDYYQTSDEAVTDYSSSCAESKCITFLQLFFSSTVTGCLEIASA
uniref:Alpha-2-macroglobulin-like protein 1 n=1 Tax=Myripristis murdjan TaxID=586833 RepID=A0A667YWP9_9TELE